MKATLAFPSCKSHKVCLALSLELGARSGESIHTASSTRLAASKPCTPAFSVPRTLYLQHAINSTTSMACLDQSALCLPRSMIVGLNDQHTMHTMHGLQRAHYGLAA
eukprot:720053-Pelagomonas_calceolata.AAC.1